MRFLGLDYGRKRIGVALSDPLRLTAQPFDTILRNESSVGVIEKIISENEVSEIVLGYPRSLNGEPSPMCAEVESFAENLSKTIKIPIHLWDERLTSAESENLLIAADVRRERRKEVRDKMAASLILQGFLEAHPAQ